MTICEQIEGTCWLRRGDKYFCNLPPVKETLALERHIDVDCVTDAEVEQAVLEWKKARDAFKRGE